MNVVEVVEQAEVALVLLNSFSLHEIKMDRYRKSVKIDFCNGPFSIQIELISFFE